MFYRHSWFYKKAARRIESNPMILSLDMIQTLAMAVVVLYVGKFLLKKVALLRQFCIPEPVVGGIVFALLTLLGHSTGWYYLSFDFTLKELFMTAFFTSVGFAASVKPLKEGGKTLIVFVFLVVLLIFLQNFVAVLMSYVVHVSPLLGLATGSIPMIGGHGSAGAFGPLLKEAGQSSAVSVSMAAATFGLIAGSLMGGPLGKSLIVKYGLGHGLEKREQALDDIIESEEKSIGHGLLSRSIYQLAIAMGLGTLVSYVLSLSGLSFPVYIGAMIVAAVMRNIADVVPSFTVFDYELSEIGSVSLNLFLAMALMSLNLWELAALALPLLWLLLAQVVLMFIFARYIVFGALGRDYDAAVMVAGVCGFGMGATPNAMANMQAITKEYYPSPKAFLVIPVVGSLFVDFLNSIGITLFINFFK